MFRYSSGDLLTFNNMEVDVKYFRRLRVVSIAFSLILRLQIFWLAHLVITKECRQAGSQVVCPWLVCRRFPW